MTAATMAGQFNKPLAVNKTAIVNHLAHHATNGPAYVQLNATKALARITGLYDQARYEAKLAFEAAQKAAQDAVQQVKEKTDGAKMTIGQRIEGLRNGTIQPSPEELAHFEPDKPVEDEDDESGSANDSEDPP